MYFRNKLQKISNRLITLLNEVGYCSSVYSKLFKWNFSEQNVGNNRSKKCENIYIMV